MKKKCTCGEEVPPGKKFCVCGREYPVDSPAAPPLPVGDVYSLTYKVEDFGKGRYKVSFEAMLNGVGISTDARISVHRSDGEPRPNLKTDNQGRAEVEFQVKKKVLQVTFRLIAAKPESEVIVKFPGYHPV